jgi:hypothetical protein
MSSFSVLYNGQKKTIKVTPNALMQSVVIEAAEFFELDPAKCSLKHKKAILDKTTPARLCNVPNLAVIELHYSNISNANISEFPCRIALSVLNGVSCTGSFSSSVTVGGMLQLFVDQGKLDADILSQAPEVIYLRTSVTGDALNSTSLGDLGLAGYVTHLCQNFLISPS